jgi:hypothetical protein
MVKASGSGRAQLVSVARGAAISLFVGVTILFLVFINRQEFWGWRLALYGGFGGVVAYVFCHFLDATVGDRVRRRKILPDKAVGVPVYFVGGSSGFLVTTLLMKALGLMPFELRQKDVLATFFVSGSISIVVGLLFYSFSVLRQRLESSIERVKEAEFAEKELDYARAIQQRLLPPPEIEGDGYRIAARNLAARFVAGDFYDVFRLADGSIGIVVADVSGKGMGAALIMASVKAVLPLLAEERSAQQTLVDLNRRLSAELAPREFVALVFARYTPATGRLELANAGLPDPYRLREGLIPVPLEVPGPRLPLGARAVVTYESLTTTLEQGDRVLFLTDGLPEAPMAGGDPIGYESFARLLPGGPEEPGACLDRVFASVRAATQPGLSDDWTALLLEHLR